MKQRRRIVKRSRRMIGAVAANPHEGSRSEILADYLFSEWGTVTPVRRQDDFGVDLFCTLTDRIGQRAVVADYFTVQVKSTGEPWHFEGPDSVRWVINYPQPLFLAWVDKRVGIVRVYHTMPRFLAGALLPTRDRLTLVPQVSTEGQVVAWQDGVQFSLSAPVLEISLGDLLNDSVMAERREVFRQWVALDRCNGHLQRQGLLRLRMPCSYRLNQTPGPDFGEMGNAAPDPAHLKRGVLTAAEAAECIGGQLGRNGDRTAALFAALFVDYLHRMYADAFVGHARWRDRLPADLGRIVCEGLNAAGPTRPQGPYRYYGVEEVTSDLLQSPRVRTFINAAAQPAVAPDGRARTRRGRG
jgi:hypothetical protein